MKAKIEAIERIAEVLPGFSPKGAVEDAPSGTHQVISARRLIEGEPYRFIPDHYLRITPTREAGNYLVNPGDVLFISRGTRNIAVEIESIPKLTITTATFYLLRITSSRILPGYLAWCVNQQPFQALLDEIRTGAGTPMIPRLAFSQIQIPIPPLDNQRSIVGLARLQSRERDLRQRLLAETAALHRAMGTAILHGFTHPGAKE
jgi:hypothetical protein